MFLIFTKYYSYNKPKKYTISRVIVIKAQLCVIENVFTLFQVHSRLMAWWFVTYCDIAGE